MSNLIISIGRQFGSGGKEIGRQLAKELGIKCFDKEIIKRAAQENGITEAMFENADEKPVNSFLYSVVTHGFPAYTTPVHNHNMLTNDKLFIMQANTIKKIADEMSAVIIGRCADDILRDRENLIKIFIHANPELRVERIKESYSLNDKEAYDMMKKVDKTRSNYYDFFANKRWGDASNYDLSIDSSIGIDKAVELIKFYIAQREK